MTMRQTLFKELALPSTKNREEKFWHELSSPIEGIHGHLVLFTDVIGNFFPWQKKEIPIHRRDKKVRMLNPKQNNRKAGEATLLADH